MGKMLDVRTVVKIGGVVVARDNGVATTTSTMEGVRTLTGLITDGEKYREECFFKMLSTLDANTIRRLLVPLLEEYDNTGDKDILEVLNTIKSVDFANHWLVDAMAGAEIYDERIADVIISTGSFYGNPDTLRLSSGFLVVARLTPKQLLRIAKHKCVPATVGIDHMVNVGKPKQLRKLLRVNPPTRSDVEARHKRCIVEGIHAHKDIFEEWLATH